MSEKFIRVFNRDRDEVTLQVWGGDKQRLEIIYWGEYGNIGTATNSIIPLDKLLYAWPDPITKHNAEAARLLRRALQNGRVSRLYFTDTQWFDRDRALAACNKAASDDATKQGVV